MARVRLDRDAAEESPVQRWLRQAGITEAEVHDLPLKDALQLVMWAEKELEALCPYCYSPHPPGRIFHPGCLREIQATNAAREIAYGIAQFLHGDPPI